MLDHGPIGGSAECRFAIWQHLQVRFGEMHPEVVSSRCQLSTQLDRVEPIARASQPTKHKNKTKTKNKETIKTTKTTTKQTKTKTQQNKTNTTKQPNASRPISGPRPLHAFSFSSERAVALRHFEWRVFRVSPTPVCQVL